MAITALHSAATGLRALSERIDVVANNLANAETTAFKRSRDGVPMAGTGKRLSPRKAASRRPKAPSGVNLANLTTSFHSLAIRWIQAPGVSSKPVDSSKCHAPIGLAANRRQMHHASCF